jgi:endonuclease-3
MKSASTTRRIIEALAALYPDADTELHYRNAYELLVATMLSAQSSDARVNLVTPGLFARYPNATALAAATPAELEPQVMSTGFFRQKSKALVTMAQILVRDHDGDVPPSMNALTTLPGVGRKTANVVLGHALGVAGLPVDRHVLRVANRIGIAEGDDAVAVEQQLCARLPAEMWTLASDVQILHGRRICRPTRPACQECPVAEDCLYYADLIRDARALIRDARAAKPRAANSRAAKGRAGAGPVRTPARARKRKP